MTSRRPGLLSFPLFSKTGFPAFGGVMDFEDKGIGWPEFLNGLGVWVVGLLIFFFVAVAVATVVSLILSGRRGPGRVAETLVRGIKDVFSMKLRRLFAIATLTWHECIRRKTLWVLAVFVFLFMFAHWFLGIEPEVDPNDPEATYKLATRTVQYASARRYVSFVMTAIQWLLIPIATILSCWGLPNDIKERSLHTVVTKPTRRSEIVLGRILGYSAVMSLVLGIMAVFGYIWLQRAVPDRAKSQLIARVPVYGSLSFISREGIPGNRGINVGDIWEYRWFIEGRTKARGVYTFENLSGSSLEGMQELPLEYNFEAFRSNKGTMGQNIFFSFHIVNPKTGVEVQYPPDSAQIYEFEVDPNKTTINIPRKLTNENAVITQVGVGDDQANVPTEVDLFDDLISDGELRVEVSCDDGQQYLGMAQPDLFFKLPDRSFLFAYTKSIFCMWMMLVLIVSLGTTASTFVKGPVATMLVVTYLVMGRLMRGFMMDILAQTAKSKPGHNGPIGGGPLESLYRIISQNNMMTAMTKNWFTDSLIWVDKWVLNWLSIMEYLIPDFRRFDGTPYLASGFDIPLSTRIIPSLLLVVGFLVPCVLIGTYTLMSRELESK